MQTAEFSLTQKRDFARQMRYQPTPAENALWFHLRLGKLGVRFHRQSVQRGYILDFYSQTLKLAIEVDGSVHELPERAAADDKKDQVLVAFGITVLRFPNEDVLEYSTVVLARIRQEVQRLKALKALAANTLHKTRDISSSNRRPCGTLEIYRRGTYSAASVPSEQRITVAQMLELSGKLSQLSRQRSMQFAAPVDERTNDEKAAEQRHKIHQWLKQKRPNASAALLDSEAQAIAVRKGMVIA
jgi:very-short-patch-repair endonuclease